MNDSHRKSLIIESIEFGRQEPKIEISERTQLEIKYDPVSCAQGGSRAKKKKFHSLTREK